jgi:hypothetical protein
MKRSIGAAELVFGIVVAALAAVMIVTASVPARTDDDAIEGKESAGAPKRTVVFNVDDPVVGYGETTRIEGRISPANPDERIELIGSSGEPFVRLRTNDDGEFSIRLSPLKSENVTAIWRDASSPPKYVEVRPQALVTLREANGGRAEVTGQVRPVLPGATAALTITRDRHPVVTTLLDVAEGGTFSFDLQMRRPGSYRAELRYSSPELRRVRALSQRLDTRSP